MSSGALSGAALSCSVLYDGYPDFRRTARTIAHIFSSNHMVTTAPVARAAPAQVVHATGPYQKFIKDRSSIPGTRTACRLAHSWPLTQIFIGYGK